jgi:hypothetical protein
MKKAADRLGTSTEIISELGYAAKTSGASIEDMESASKFLQKNLVNNADVFKQFGLNAEALRKIDLGEQMATIFDAIAAMPDPAERTAAAIALMGRGATSLLPLIQSGSGGLRRAREEARKVGESVNSIDAANAERIGDAFDRAWTAVKNTILSVGAALLPQVDTIERWTSSIVEAAKLVRDFINENRQVILIVVGVASAIAAAGAAFIGIGTALFVASIAASGFAAAASTVVAWAPTVGIVLAITAAIAGLGYVLNEFTPIGEHAKKLFGEIGRIGSWAFGILSTAWTGIKAALASGDVGGAIDIARSTLDVFWKAIKVGAQAAWNFAKETALDAWDDIVGEAKKARVDIDTEMRIFGTDMEGYFKGVFKTIWDAYTKGWAAAFKNQVNMAKAASEADWKMRKWIMNNWRGLMSGATSISGIGTIQGETEAAIDKAAEGKALADQVGGQTAQEILRAKGEELKAAIDAATAQKKAARRLEDKAALDEQIAELKEAEAALNAKVNDMRRNQLTQIATSMVFAGMGAMLAQAQDNERQEAINAGQGRTRGQSSGNLAAQALGIHGGSVPMEVQKKQLEELKAIRKAVEGETDDDDGGVFGW